MDQEEYDEKLSQLKILKAVQEYLKTKGASPTVVYPIRVPDQLVYENAKRGGAETTDQLIHEIFQAGLKWWSDALYQSAFGSQKNLQEFIETVKKRNRDEV